MVATRKVILLILPVFLLFSGILVQGAEGDRASYSICEVSDTEAAESAQDVSGLSEADSVPGTSSTVEAASIRETSSTAETESVSEASGTAETESVSEASGAAEADSIREASSVPAAEEKRTVRLDVSLTGPPCRETVWYAAHRSSDGRKWKNDIVGKMRKEAPVTKGGNVWEHVFTAELPSAYDEIRFSFRKPRNASTYQESGNSTDLLNIPKELGQPCFYLDADDPSAYDNVPRGGYWNEAYEIRDPETEFAEKKRDSSGAADHTADGLVCIPEGDLSADSSVLYLDCDLYDYYTDFELNGISRTGSGSWEKSYRTWIPFRNLNEALSGMYQENGGIPLYVGHFQPDIFEELKFSRIAPTLNLTGWDDPEGFFSTNNSSIDAKGGGSADAPLYAYAAQGLVGAALKDGYPVCTRRSGTAASGTAGAAEEDRETASVLPLFSETFLEGRNNRNTKVGKVYRHTAFPFRQIDRDGDGIPYWSFDSAADHVHLLKPGTGQTDGFEWLLGDPVQESGSDEDAYHWSKNMTSSGTADTASVSDTYGFFPLNPLTGEGNAGAWNFGFGLRLAFDFSLPEDGTLTDRDGKKKPAVFTFSGDDDLWIFIDGKLALDVGGDHGKVEGTLNFADLTASVSNVKKSQGMSDVENGPRTVEFKLDGAENGKHELVLFYMERGMWESNLKLQFNMAPERTEEPEKLELPFTGENGIPVTAIIAGIAVILVSCGYLNLRDREP